MLDHFRTFAKLKEATPEQLQKVEGIGPKLADKLAVFLAEA
ncbi:MAG: helix-hairpin-helix domain-containing protein [Bacteroidota bacterium]